MAIDAIGPIGTGLAPVVQAFVPAQVADNTLGSRAPQASDYNRQAEIGLAFAAPAAVPSLASQISTAAAVSVRPAVQPVEKLAALTRLAIYAGPVFIDEYR